MPNTELVPFRNAQSSIKTKISVKARHKKAGAHCPALPRRPPVSFKITTLYKHLLKV